MIRFASTFRWHTIMDYHQREPTCDEWSWLPVFRRHKRHISVAYTRCFMVQTQPNSTRSLHDVAALLYAWHKPIKPRQCYEYL